MKRHSILLVALLAVGCGEDRTLPAGDPERPDIIVLSIDTLRPDHLGSYGYTRDTSPYLDGLAAEGTRFADAWAPSPWTLPSHATMLTGLRPLDHLAIEEDFSVDKNAPAVAERFQSEGYGTMASVTSVFVSGKYGLDRGFSAFEDFGIATGDFPKGQEIDAEEVFEAAMRWAGAQADGQPLFLFLHVYDVHYPYDAPAPFNEKFNRAVPREELAYENYFHYLRQPLNETQMRAQVDQYDEEIAYTDDQLRRFHEAWVDERPNTTLVVVSDHGEEFGERGSWGHAHTLLPEVLRVPWIVSGPEVRTQVCPDRVGLEDLAPTLAGLAGIDLRGAAGSDLSDYLRSGSFEAQTPRAPIAGTSRHRSAQLRWHRPPLDLIVDLGRGSYALFDLAADPRAAQNLLPDRTEQAIELNNQLFQSLGQPWVVQRGGSLESDGAILMDGARQSSPVEVEAGRRFYLYPPNASIRILIEDGSTGGPWSLLGGAMPHDQEALRYEGTLPDVGPAELSAEQEERLRALGYIR